jgi:DNA-directed RNA polymerase subunit M/transcription elongation factor TFIIS
MKFCETCGDEIFTRDGDNTCRKCEDAADTGTATQQKRRRSKASANRKAREDVLRSCGLVKVRGSLGGTYWE